MELFPAESPPRRSGNALQGMLAQRQGCDRQIGRYTSKQVGGRDMWVGADPRAARGSGGFELLTHERGLHPHFAPL